MASFVACVCKVFFTEAWKPTTWGSGGRFLSQLGFSKSLSPYGNPLPPKLHVKLTENDISGKRVFVVGDVHGCYDELMDLLSAANALSDDVQVAFVGDLLNKGPKNAECLELAQRINALCVRGNHDEVALREFIKCGRPWGNSNPSLGLSWVLSVPHSSWAWLSDLPYSISFPWLGCMIVHAGLVPGVPLEKQRVIDMIELRNVVPSETSSPGDDGSKSCFEGTKNTDRGQSWASAWKGPEHVYFGHDARRGFQDEPYATGLDTGCVYGGCLTGLYLDDPKKLYQVTAKKAHRPT